MAKLHSLFNMMKQQGASDLHISTGAPPIFRLSGEMEKLNNPLLSNQQARALLLNLLKAKQISGEEACRCAIDKKNFEQYLPAQSHQG